MNKKEAESIHNFDNTAHNAASDNKMKNLENIHGNDKVYVECRSNCTIGSKIWKEIAKEM